MRAVTCPPRYLYHLVQTLSQQLLLLQRRRQRRLGDLRDVLGGPVPRVHVATIWPLLDLPARVPLAELGHDTMVWRESWPC